MTDDAARLAVDSLRIEAAEGQCLVEDVSLSIQRGQAVGIVGESGAGKSLTGQVLAGIVPRSLRVEAGAVTVGHRVEGQHCDGRLGRVGYIFQQPRASLNPVLRVGEQIAIVLRRHGTSGRDARAASDQLLQRVGFAETYGLLRQYPHQLSGGMAQRVAIAVALASRPDFLVADEPTTALDVTIQMQVIQHLRSAVETQGVGLVLISHDLGLVADTCEFVYVMFAGKVVEEGPVDSVVSSPGHPYTLALLQASGLVDPSRPRAAAIVTPNPLEQDSASPPCSFLTRCPLATTECRDQPELSELPIARQRARCFHSERVGHD